MKIFKNLSPMTIGSLLIFCFISYFVLSWILLFRDPRAIIGIGNLYPELKDVLFSTQVMLSGYGLNSLPTIGFAAVSGFAILLYLHALRLKFTLKQIIVFACIFQSLTFLSFPILSTDIFSYIFSERVSTVHNENIWQVKPATFPDDQFGVLADWKDTTSVYGGVHYLLYLVPSLIGQNDLLSLVILYKLVPALFASGIMYLTYLLLKEHKKSTINFWLIFIFWNPLFVLEIFGSGHNDSMMIFFTLLSYFLLQKKYWLLSGIAMAFAVQVKLIPIILCFFFVLHLIRRKAYKASLVLLSGFVIVNTLLFLYMQVNLLDFIQRVAYNGGVYWQSLQTIAQNSNPQLNQFILVTFFVWLGYFIWKTWKQQLDPMSSYVGVLFVYLLFVSSAYWNWYVLWMLPMIPFVARKNLLLSIIALSITSLFAYPLLWVIYRINVQSDIWPIVTYLFIFLPPIVLYMLQKYQPERLALWLSKVKLNHLIAEKA